MSALAGQKNSPMDKDATSRTDRFVSLVIIAQSRAGKWARSCYILRISLKVHFFSSTRPGLFCYTLLLTADVTRTKQFHLNVVILQCVALKLSFNILSTGNSGCKMCFLNAGPFRTQVCILLSCINTYFLRRPEQMVISFPVLLRSYKHKQKIQ